MLLSLLLAKIRILSCFFFLFLIIFSDFLTISVVREKIKVELALTIRTGAPTILVNEIIDTPLLVALKKQLKSCLCYQKKLHIYLIFHCMIFFD